MKALKWLLICNQMKLIANLLQRAQTPEKPRRAEIKIHTKKRYFFINSAAITSKNYLDYRATKRLI
jgi:hypothetical protein